MTIAVTGASGQLGRLAIDELLSRTPADNIVALVRDPAKVADIADRGVTVRTFDYDQPDALAGALEGVDRLLFISGNAIGQRIPQHKAVIDAAVEAGVDFVAYTSFLHTDQASIIAVAPEHNETERLLAEAPVKVGLLRNGWYTENHEDQVKQAVQSGTLVSSAGDARISAAPRRDYAAAAAVVLTADEAPDATYELGADESFTYADLAATASELSGKTVTVANVSPEEHKKVLVDAGTPEPLADFLVSTDAAIAAGELEDPAPGEFSELIGRPTTPLADVVKTWVG
ncbi:MAG: SDR family oxidoreductase [Mycobacteriaceae bacterium]|uniref:SDR family oxidoreductase n=1 Tax=Corynebacterium sp. TaxID=1720 RepID=UPI003F9CFF72